MKDDGAMQLVSLYRASANEEPDERLDAAILAASRRRSHPYRAAMLLAVLALAAALATLPSQKPAHPPVEAARSESSLPPGMDDGRGHFLAASAAPERLGMNAHPQFESGRPGEE